jgi:hypothetical protein
MASGLNDVARQYPGRGENQALPVVASLRLAMNVAACDKLPLVVVVSDSAQERRTLENQMAPLAWGKDLIGELTYASCSRSELHGIIGATISKGYVFVSPGEFGNEGRAVAQLNANATTAQLDQAMKYTIMQHHPAMMDHREHIRLGRMEGISWTPATPVTDPHQPGHEQAGGNSPGGFNRGPAGGQGFGPGGGQGFGPGGGQGFGPGGGQGFGPGGGQGFGPGGGPNFGPGGEQGTGPGGQEYGPGGGELTISPRSPATRPGAGGYSGQYVRNY